MKNRAIFLLSSIATILHPTASSATEQAERRGSQIWIERPWSMRYYLFLETLRGMELTQEVAARTNQRDADAKSDPVYLCVEHLFKPTTVLKTPDMRIPGDNYLATMVIEFDRSGHVLTPNASAKPLVGKLTQLHDIALTSDESGNEKPYFLARWFWGLPGDTTAFSPAVCSGVEDDRYIKGHDGSKNSSLGNFGCREWTYQLYDPDRPYIDVTSYEGRHTYVKPFVGWSRFGDPPKPVIGKHDKTWLCLHECPAGEAPGIIPDIAAWCKKHGLPLPKRPKKQPMFPNADFPFDPDE